MGLFHNRLYETGNTFMDGYVANLIEKLTATDQTLGESFSSYQNGVLH